MSLKEKRIRSINWDEEEKQLFRSVLQEFARIIENKSLDNNVNVHQKFNELNGRFHSLNQLKIQWKTMKINARKEVSHFKRATNKTGGGGRPQTPTNDAIEITDLLNPAELLRDENIYDSDGIVVGRYCITSEDVSASETCILTLQDITENTSVVTVVEDQIPGVSQESIPRIDNAPDNKTKNNMEPFTPKNIFKHIKNLKKPSKSPCHAKSNNYVDTMVNYSKSLKDQEHQKRMEILEAELNIQKEKLKCAVLEREILEIRKAKELM